MTNQPQKNSFCGGRFIIINVTVNKKTPLAALIVKAELCVQADLFDLRPGLT